MSVQSEDAVRFLCQVNVQKRQTLSDTDRWLIPIGWPWNKTLY